MPTREQVRAQCAYSRVSIHKGQAYEAKYQGFAKRFPALLQTCGLAQALAFAEAKKQTAYLEDLATVIGACNTASLTENARQNELSSYQKLSRDAMSAATWLKRYAEALLEGDGQ